MANAAVTLAKRRWKKIPPEERRKVMQEVGKSRIERANARKLAEAIDLVKAAGYRLQPDQMEKAS